MENLDARKQALIAEITAAFDGVAREDGVSLSEAHVIDNYGSDEERAAARAEDTESRWQDVPDEHLGWSDAVLYFVDAKGFRYYLPAYMVWYVKYIDIPNDWNDTNFDSLIRHLTVNPIISGSGQSMHEAVAACMGLTLERMKENWSHPSLYVNQLNKTSNERRLLYRSFTQEQSKAIAHFLEFAAALEAECQAESLAYDGEEWKRKYLDNDAVSQEEADVALRELKQFQANVGLLDNDAQRALDLWRGQFL